MDSNLAAYGAYEGDRRREEQQQPNLIDALGKLALGAGAIAAGAYGLRRYLKPGAQAAAEMSPVQRTAAAPPAAVIRQRQVQELTRQARAERMPGVIQTDLSKLAGQATELPSTYYKRQPGTLADITRAQREITGINAAERLAQDPELLNLVKQQQAEELSEARSYQAKAQAEYRNLLSARADEIISSVRQEPSSLTAAAQQDYPRQYLAQSRYVEPSMVVQQQAETAEHVEHAVNALNAAQDQEAARAAQTAVRDVLGARDLGAINARANALEVQYENFAQRTGSNPPVDAAMTQAVQEATGEAVVDQAERTFGPMTAQEMVEQAKQEMLIRRQAVAERGLQPGTVRFERALAEPFRTSAAEQVRLTGPVSTTLPTGPIRQTVQAVSASEALPEQALLNIGPQAVITQTPAGTAIRGASPSYHEALPKQETRLLYGTAEPLVPGAPEELGQDIPGKERVRGVLSSLKPEERSKQEIIYSVLDRPGAQEVPGGSAGIGIYGVEPSYVPGAMSRATGEYSAAAERRPSQPTFKERKTGFEGLTSEQLTAAAEQAQSPRIRSAFEEEAARRATTKTSLEVSEALRRARIEGRDPQSVLRSLGFGV